MSLDDIMQKLTKAEEQLMQVLWKLGKGLRRDILDALPAPRPKESTVSTILRILEDKGFVQHNTYGKTFEYYPLVSKADYAKFYFKGFLGKYFDGSFQNLLSFFHKEGELDINDLDEIMKTIEENDGTTD